MINHPSYANTECTEADVYRAISASVQADGAKMSLGYSRGAEQILELECEWVHPEKYVYRGTDIDGRPWRVALHD